jgi:hypothetical protein
MLTLVERTVDLDCFLGGWYLPVFNVLKLDRP